MGSPYSAGTERSAVHRRRGFRPSRQIGGEASKRHTHSPAQVASRGTARPMVQRRRPDYSDRRKEGLGNSRPDRGDVPNRSAALGVFGGPPWQWQFLRHHSATCFKPHAAADRLSFPVTGHFISERQFTLKAVLRSSCYPLPRGRSRAARSGQGRAEWRGEANP